MRGQAKQATEETADEARVHLIIPVSRAEKKALKRRAIDEDTTVGRIVRRALKLSETPQESATV